MTRVKLTPLLAIAAVAISMGLSACNTVQGAGEDVKATGGAISGAAQDVKSDMKKDDTKKDDVKTAPPATY